MENILESQFIVSDRWCGCNVNGLEGDICTFMSKIGHVCKRTITCKQFVVMRGMSKHGNMTNDTARAIKRQDQKVFGSVKC